MDDYILARLSGSIENAVSRLGLNLKELTIVTECATSIYGCTPAIAAVAGAAKILAFGKDSRYGTFNEAQDNLLRLWHALNLSESNLFITDREPVLEENLNQADIVTNSGHLRPLNSQRIFKMKQGSVIPLMYESWEFRSSDISLETCRSRNIPVAGTNERHPDIAVFEYLGPLTAKALFDAGLEIEGNTILLISDNDFGSYIEKTLKDIGACVLNSKEGTNEGIDAIIFSHTPISAGGTLDIHSLNLPRDVPVCCQLWGDLDRTDFKTKWVPKDEPKPGHMGLMLSSLGVEPTVRLQSGGLKVGEILARAIRSGLNPQEAVNLSIEKGIGQKLTD